MEISIITFIGEARAVAVPASDAGLKTLPLDGELVRWGSGPRSEPVLQIGDQDPFAVSCALGTFAETGDRSLVLRPVAGSPILVEFVDSKAVSKKEEVMAWLQSCALGQSLSVFDTRTEATSADSYFRYYGMLLHQQNMLQVCGIRTHNCAHLYNKEHGLPGQHPLSPHRVFAGLPCRRTRAAQAPTTRPSYKT